MTMHLRVWRRIRLFPQMLTTEQDAAVSKAEVRIRKILIDIENESGVHVDHVDVDARNFANLAVAIVVRENLNA